MKLEVGRRYVTRDGKVTEPARKNVGDAFRSTHPFEVTIEGADRYTYQPNGLYRLGNAESKFDLVSEYEEPSVSNKADRLNKLVDEMPVCDDGRAKIRALVEEITGEKLTKPKAIPKDPPKAGEVWGLGDSSYYIIDGPGGDLINLILNNNGKPYCGSITGKHLVGWAVESMHKVADSLAEYVANGGKL